MCLMSAALTPAETHASTNSAPSRWQTTFDFAILIKLTLYILNPCTYTQLVPDNESFIIHSHTIAFVSGSTLNFQSTIWKK